MAGAALAIVSPEPAVGAIAELLGPTLSCIGAAGLSWDAVSLRLAIIQSPRNASVDT